MKKWSVKLLLVFLLSGLVWTFYTQWLIYSVEQQQPSKSDVGIVLGASLWDNYPSPGLQERLNKAYDLYMEGYFSDVIVSGGLDYNGSTITEAEGMKRYLVSKGIPVEHIFIEDQARSTYQNLLFSQAIMSENDWEKALIITHEFHGARSQDIADFLDYRDPIVTTVKSEVLWMPWHKARETLAFTKWYLEKALIQLQDL
ncbi:YdcF family protein [Ammoniphilus resinae]|nr:YdcF family protein [Ammoniphilus resinae]